MACPALEPNFRTPNILVVASPHVYEVGRTIIRCFVKKWSNTKESALPGTPSLPNWRSIQSVACKRGRDSPKSLAIAIVVLATQSFLRVSLLSFFLDSTIGFTNWFFDNLILAFVVLSILLKKSE